MKILHIISGVNPKNGGPIQGIRNYQNSLFYLGVERHIATFEDPNDILLWDFPETLKFHALGKPKTSWQYNSKLIPFLINEASNYDVLIINGLWTYHSYAVTKAIQNIKKKSSNQKLPKVYVMPHGMLDPWFQKDKTRRLKAIRNFFYWHLIEKKVINTSDGLLFTCEEELFLARNTFSGYHPKKEQNIGYGIEAPPPLSEELKIAFKSHCNFNTLEPYLLFLSRIHPKKGVDLLIRAYCELLSDLEFANKIPNLIIAGPGIESEYGKKLLEFIEENPNIKPKINFVGHLFGETKWSAIYGCEAFVLPSHQENFGIAVAEALACNKPVLITNKVNIYIEIEQGGAGIISDDTLAGTINNLKNWLNLSTEVKEKMSENAYFVYETNFGVKNAAIRLIESIK